MNAEKMVYLPKVHAYCNIDTSDFQWHGWLLGTDQDCTGHAWYLRKATEKQYAEAVRRHRIGIKNPE